MSPSTKEAWDQQKLMVMRDLLIIKTKSCESFRLSLLKTWPHPITHNAYNPYWGTHYYEDSIKRKGANMFANTLMQIRFSVLDNIPTISRTLAAQMNPQSAIITGLNNAPNTITEALHQDNQSSLDTSGDISEETFERAITEESTPKPHSPERPRIPSKLELYHMSFYQKPTKAPTPAPRRHTMPTPAPSTSPTQTTHTTPPSQTTNTQTPLTHTTIIGTHSHKYPSLDKPKWKLPKLTEKLVIIGDSNVSKILQTPNNTKSIEIHSFPGARFSHMTDILNKDTLEHTQTQNTILSIGINSRNNGPTFNNNQIEKLLNTYHKWQPHMDKAIALVPFDPTKLTPKDTDAINQINTDIKRHAKKLNLTILDSIPQSQFEVGQDTIHWTKTTANKIAKYWINSLNWQPASPKDPPL